MDDNFGKWLELATDLAEKSIKNYLGAIRKINLDLSEQNIVQMTLEEINSTEELEIIKKDYFLNPEYKELDEKGNGMYSAAFNKFVELPLVERAINKSQGEDKASNCLEKILSKESSFDHAVIKAVSTLRQTDLKGDFLSLYIPPTSSADK